ncbi:hypothetical protein RRV45_07810 [Bacillus sp. DTU_2020_1000418_1_SI_GHA_SEK_038]|uniref:UPF0738 family protein n=1 Tax=Bacillus sp. DTU_2020_1000418_1_SI_GHA_SEK_038 TaxID=3077585 RepID=UPI0028E6BA50|nr:hypothetical protein [Bacillus sp. DTU_2020_1000418_1_SI_GHA_SEK_038]WNS76881.1 hypothetical protein RRV45_07810 [Bacillus sp. DTU_2020_1000418_1_SI_GHA_SEK_038]
MTKKISIIDAVFRENEREIEIIAEEGYSINDLKPMEQMLVDSDNLSFIYITDMNDEYTYLAIPHSIWSQLKSALDLEYRVYLTDRNERIHLPGFIEELSYLIENIKGNSNYGEEMVEKVESVF